MKTRKHIMLAILGAVAVSAPIHATTAKMVYRHTMSDYQAPPAPPVQPVPVVEVSGNAVMPPIPGMWFALPVVVSGADSISLSGLPPLLQGRTVGEGVQVRLLSSPPYTPLTLSVVVVGVNSAGSSSGAVTIQIGG